MDNLPLGRVLTAFALAVICSPGVLAQPSNQPDEFFWVPNGQVNAMAETNGVLYIGGSFSRIAPITGGFVSIDPGTGELREPVERFAGTISVAVPDGQGGWFVGGDFSVLGVTSRTYLAHLLRDGSVDSAWVSIPNARVSSLVLAGERLFVGGEFTEINGQPRLYLAELNPRTAQLRPLDLGLNGSVLSLAVDNSKLFLGGLFTRVLSEDRSRLAAIDLSSNGLADWRVDCDSISSRGVRVLTHAGGRLFVAGDFATIGTSNRNGLAAVESSTGRVLPWDPNPSGEIIDGGIAVVSNRVYIAGSFGPIGGGISHWLAAVDTDAGQLLNWSSPIVSGPLHAMAVAEGNVYVGGEFNPGPRFLAAIDGITGEFKTWDPSPNGPVTLLAAGNDELYVGGEFNSIGGVARGRLAALDVATGRPTSWNPNFIGGDVVDLTLDGETLFAAGTFTSGVEEPRLGLCALRRSDGTVLPFDAQILNPVSLKRIAVWETNLFVGGILNIDGQIPASGFAILNAQTGVPIDWDPLPNAVVYDFAVAHGQLYLSVEYPDPEGGEPRYSLAAIDLRTRQTTRWQPTANFFASALAVSGSYVLLTGEFTKVNGRDQWFVAAVDATTGELNRLQPTATAPVRSMTTHGSSFYGVGGRGVTKNFDLFTGASTPWAPVIEGPLHRILATSDKIYVAGGFNEVEGRRRPALAAFTITNASPTVTLISPSESVEIRLPVDLELKVDAEDPNGTIVRVDYYADGKLVASSSQHPYSALWNPRTIGDYIVAAVAIDNAGGRGMSSSVHVTALPPVDDILPTLEVVSPSRNGVIQEGTALLAAADASDPDSRLDRVEFFLHTNLVAVVTNRPYSAVLTNLAWGRYSLTARVTDEFGVTTIAAPIEFRVNSQPTVDWLFRPSGAMMPGTNLQLSVFPRDRDGVIQTVHFFSGTNLLVVLTNAPFYLMSPDFSPGHHEVVATAIDDSGGVGQSAPASFFIISPPANDTFAQRISLPPTLGQVLGSNNFASIEPGEPLHLGFGSQVTTRSVWWTWTPDFTGAAFVTTRGSSVNQVVLAVYTGNSLGSLRQIASSVGVYPTNRISLSVTNGTAYQIAVSSLAYSAGPIVLTTGPEVTLHAGRGPGNGWHLRYDGPTNLNYILQSSPTPISWIAIRTNPPGTEQRFELDSPTIPLQYNRLLLPVGP